MVNRTPGVQSAIHVAPQLRTTGYSSSISIAWPIPPATHIDSMP